MAIAALLTISVVGLTGYAVSLEPEPSSHGTYIDGPHLPAELPDGAPAPPEEADDVGDPLYYAGNNRSGPVAISVTSAQLVNDPASGQQPLVVVRLNITNSGPEALSLTAWFFKLTGSDGTSYFHWSSGFSMPTSVGSGGTGAVTVVYQLPSGVTPKQLVYNDILNIVSVDLTGVWPADAETSG